MEVNKILSADFLDILFDERNKEYGAYELRKNYQRRLTTALLATAGAALLIFLMVIVGRSVGNDDKNKVKMQEVNLEEIKTDEPQKIEPPPPPPPKQEPPKIEITKFTPPKIVEDEKFEEKNEVKEQEEITNVGKIDQEGIKDPEIVNPPKVEEESKVVEAPKEDPNQVFTKVEVEAQFPGGEGKWNQYVQREVEKNIDDLVDDGQAGTCEVQFIVDKEGNVSNVEALSMKGSKLAEVAVNAIKRGPKWIPAIQNGRQVKAWRRQKITFRLPDEQP
jgi:protein TonB